MHGHTLAQRDPTNNGARQTTGRGLFHQRDRNWYIVARREYADGAGANARVVERYAYTPYGEFMVLKGDGGSVRRPLPILGGSAPKPPASIPNRRAPGEQGGRGSTTWSYSHSDWYINWGQVRFSYRHV